MAAGLLTLCLVGCTDDSPDPDTEPRDQRVDGVTAEWTRTEMSAKALPDGVFVSMSDALPPVGDLPMIFSGSTAEPGEPAAATIWARPQQGEPAPQVWDLGGGSSASVLATDGTTTYAAGYVRADGRSRPFAQSSSDRRTWTPVDLPEEVTDRDLGLGSMVVGPRGAALAFGVDADDQPAVVDLTAGDVVDLPAAGRGEVTGISAAAQRGKEIVVLGEIARAGRTSTFGYLSTDGGQTWTRTTGPGGAQPVVSDVVPVRGGFVATGSTLRGTNRAAAAWSSDNGRSWCPEPMPPLRDYVPGWDTAIMTATAADGEVFAAVQDDEKLFAEILVRTASGEWRVRGATGAWLSPGTAGVGSTIEVTESGSVIVARDWNGRVQFGLLDGSGSWSPVGPTFGAGSPVERWDSVALLGDRPVLVGARQQVTTESDGGWTSTSQLGRFAVTGESVRPVGWEPQETKGLSGLGSATDDRGASVQLGERIFPSDDPAESDESDVVGWYQGADDSGWTPVKGLAGPRTEFLGDVTFLDGIWVAVGTDRASFTTSDHSFAAVWTSADGRTWRRADGDFDAMPDRDSGLNDVCRLPDGDLLAVGSIEDPARGAAPLAFRFSNGSWEQADLSSLSNEITNLVDCAGVGGLTLVQGIDQAGQQRIAGTADGSAFEEVTVGGEDDYVGTFVAIDGGFVAGGFEAEGDLSRPVVWLSADGADWASVEVPSDRTAVPSTVLDWNGRLVVPMSFDSGPEVQILENAAELIQTAG